MQIEESGGASHPRTYSLRAFKALNSRLGIVRQSRVYIVEHVIVLVSLALILISGIGLFNATVNHFIHDTEAANAWGAVISFEELALYLAIAIVAMPVFLLFYTRTRIAERYYPDILEARNRRRLSYVFLMISSLFILGFAIGLVYTTVLALIGSNVGGGGEQWLNTMLKDVFAIEFIGLATYFVSRMSSGLVKGAVK